MKRLAMFRALALIIAVVGLLMVPPLVMALALEELFMVFPFLIPLGIGLFLAALAVIFIPKSAAGLRPRDGFLLVFLTWAFASLLGSLPYYFAPAGLNLGDAVFESACGFTTTGATTIFDIEAQPRSLLLWRSISFWAGGMGIVLLTAALLPLLGVGGFQLIKAEAPGLGKEKLTPRITDAAKILWRVYCVFTALLIVLYRIGGMGWFDAVCQGLATIATGGVSVRNEGLAYYHSPFIDWVTVIFMLLGAINFNLYYRAVRGKFRDITRNTELRVFLLLFAVSGLGISITLIPRYGSFAEALRFGVFQTAAILSTTGIIRTEYTAWPFLVQAILFCLMLTGGCSGSTAGGIKVIRITVLFKQAVNELRRVLYPQGVFSIRLNHKVGRKDVVYSVAGFVFLYMAVAGLATLVTAAAGLDVFSSFSTALAMLGNIGVGFSKTGPGNNYQAGVPAEFPAWLKWFYSLVMITGRLELWTVFVLFTPEYWRR